MIMNGNDNLGLVFYTYVKAFVLLAKFIKPIFSQYIKEKLCHCSVC